MIKDQELSPEQLKAIGTIEKLLRLAGRNTNEAEASAAAAKAQELMTLWNLDQAAVEDNTGETKRADEKLKGGHFEYQRELWGEVAKLNFCLYFSMTVVEKTYKNVLKDKAAPHLGFKKVEASRKTVRQHRIVGRVVNTKSTRVMSEYLETTIDRITDAALVTRFGEEEAPKKRYSQWANSFREGMAERICEKIYDRRRDLMTAEREKAEEAARQATKAGMEGVSTSTAVTIAGFSQAEKDANDEFLEPGILEKRARWKAEIAAERAARAQAQAEAEAAYTRWAEANPIEAKLQADRARRLEEAEAKREARNAARRTGYGRYYREPQYKGDLSAKKAGYEAGDQVSINQQADRRKSSGAIG